MSLCFFPLFPCQSSVCHHFKPRIPNCPERFQTNQKPHSSEVCRKDSAGTPAMEVPRKDARTEDPSRQLSPPTIAPKRSLWRLHIDLSLQSAANFYKTGAKKEDIQALHSFNTKIYNYTSSMCEVQRLNYSAQRFATNKYPSASRKSKINPSAWSLAGRSSSKPRESETSSLETTWTAAQFTTTRPHGARW